MEGPSNNNRDQYVARINRVLDYVDEHLDQDLSLEALAEVACFSKFHFSRIFAAHMGETCARFIKRVRVERAANKLIHNQGASIIEIALECGFSNPETFARAFRDVLGMSASQWRDDGHLDNSNNRQAMSNLRQAVEVSDYYIDSQTQEMTWRIKMKNQENEKVVELKVEVKELPEMNVAYVRHVGPYQGDANLFAGLIGKIMSWAGPRGLIRMPETKLISIYHDDPEITDDDKNRVSVAITVPEGTEVGGEVGAMKVAGGKYAVGHFELDPTEYGAAWQALYGDWLPQSGFQPDDRPPYELYLNDPNEHPEGKCVVDICVPVKPL